MLKRELKLIIDNSIHSLHTCQAKIDNQLTRENAFLSYDWKQSDFTTSLLKKKKGL